MAGRNILKGNVTYLADLRERIGNIILAYDKQGRPVTTKMLEVDGAMTGEERLS